MKFAYCLFLLIMSILSSFAQKPKILVLCDSAVNTRIVPEKTTIDFFFSGFKNIKYKTMESFFWFQTGLTPLCDSLQKPYLTLTTAQVTDSVTVKSWDFLRKYDFYIIHKANKVTGIYKATNKAAFYSIE